MGSDSNNVRLLLPPLSSASHASSAATSYRNCIIHNPVTTHVLGDHFYNKLTPPGQSPFVNLGWFRSHVIFQICTLLLVLGVALNF